MNFSAASNISATRPTGRNEDHLINFVTFVLFVVNKFVDHEGHEAHEARAQGLFVKTTFKGNEEGRDAVAG
jgi:hypothetical protein